MKALDKLQNIQDENKSMICLGLDLDPKRMPPDYIKNPKGMFDFALKIVQATSDQVCAYKPNLAFYESFGTDGISILKMIIDRIPDNIPVIVDAKRGDIGNTAAHYAHAIFEILNADWVTLNPYMGYDSLRPFLEYKDRGSFILCLTSNPGSKDFQVLKVDNKPLYEIVAEKVVYWNKSNNCGLVVGATAPQQLKEIRDITEDMPLLIPGVGAQGGSLEDAAINGTARFTKPALINVSRSVIYASNGDDFADRAREELIKLNSMVTRIRNNNNYTVKSQPQENQKPEQPEPDKINVLINPKHQEPNPNQHAPEPQKSERTFDNNIQHHNSTPIQSNQKNELGIDLNKSNSHSEESHQRRDSSQEQKPDYNTNQSDNYKSEQLESPHENEKPKPVQKIIPPPILKPPPLPSFNKRNDSENKK